MAEEQPRNDIKSIWQNQPMGASTMTIKLIRAKARDLQAKTRRQLLGTLAGPLVAGFFYGFGITQFPSLAHLLHPLFAFALVWSLAGLYFLNRGMWSAAMPGDAGFSSGLEFCRSELERRRNLLRRLLLWSLAPILWAIGTFILALGLIGKQKGLFPNGLPFLFLLVAWIFAYFVMRVREQRELQREIDELNDLEMDEPR
jgi:hypothetical protein